MILVSSKSIAAYIYCPPGKNYDFEQMTDDLLEKLTSEGISHNIQEVYADGWDDISNGLSDLISDSKSYSLTILYSLEGLTIDDIASLIGNGCSVYCAMAPYIGTVTKTRSDSFKALAASFNAEDYYKSLRSMKIKVGMKNTDRHVGNIPFGHLRKEDGTIVAVPEKMKLAQEVGELYKDGVAVSEITYMTDGELSARQIYGLMSFWGVKRDK